MDASLVFSISGTSPSSATTAVLGSVIDTQALPSGTGSGLDMIDQIDIVASTLGATGGTLDLYVQTSPDNVTFTDLVHLTQIAAAAPAAQQRSVSSRWLTQNPTVVGQGLTPALAATTAAGAPQRYLRVVAKAGASTSAGAAQSFVLIATGSRKATS